MNIQSCEYCRKMITCSAGGSNNPNTQMIGINGTMTFFKNGFKKYLKACCLMSYYVGSDNLSNYLINQKFSSIVKPKVPKYCITNNEAFPIYEINYKDNQTITNPGSPNDNDKLEIRRYLNIIECNSKYKIVSKIAYDKQLKEWQLKTQELSGDVDMDRPFIDKPQYVYLIQERTAVIANQSIYKIGRTEQPNFDRFKGYVKGYKVLLHVACENCRVSEKMIMDQFKKKYRQATEYGNEYFEGDYKNMISNITNIVFG